MFQPARKTPKCFDRFADVSASGRKLTTLSTHHQLPLDYCTCSSYRTVAVSRVLYWYWRPFRFIFLRHFLTAYSLPRFSTLRPQAQAADTSRTQIEMYPCGLTLLNDTFICHCNTIQQLILRISRRKNSRETYPSCRISY
jgi:hypothetical protein